MNDKQFAAIIEKLDLMNKLLLNLVKDSNFNEKVLILKKTSMKESETVKLLGEKRPRVHSILLRHQKR